MPLLAIAHLTLAIAFAVHVVRTGREMYWIFILLSFPLFGAFIYFFAIVMPEASRSRTAQQAVRGVGRIIDPDKAYREASRDLQISPTSHNMCVLAELCIERNAFEEAIILYRQALTGLNVDAPDILAGLARAYFLKRAYDDVIATLDQLRDKNPDYHSANVHMIYARALESLGRDDEALEEYEALVRYFSGEEARCRYALLLKKVGRRDEAEDLLKAITDLPRLAPRRYVRAQREWIDLALVNLRR